MKTEFESHCREYNLEYNLAEVGCNYKETETHKAYIIFKSLYGKDTRPEPNKFMYGSFDEYADIMEFNDTQRISFKIIWDAART